MLPFFSGSCVLQGQWAANRKVAFSKQAPTGTAAAPAAVGPLRVHPVHRTSSRAPLLLTRVARPTGSPEPEGDDSQAASSSSQQGPPSVEGAAQAAGPSPQSQQEPDPAASQFSSSGTPLPDAAGGSSSLGVGQQTSGAGAAAVGGGGGSGGAGPSAVTLLSRFNGVGYTFVLAGFLKIMTVGGLTLSAPTDVARTAFGKATPYLMVPVGLGLCWIAKQVVDTGLNESKRFLQYLAVALVVAYFGLVKLMYKYEPQTDWVRRPRPRMPGQMAELRAQLGDRELLAAGDMDSARFYQADKPGSRELYDDVAWYEGRYPSQLAAPGQQQKRGAARRAALAVTDTEEEYTRAATPDASRQGPRARMGGSSAEGVSAPARRSFLSDNTR